MADLELNQTNCEMVQCGAIPASVINGIFVTPPGMEVALPFASACTAMGWQGPLGGRMCSDPVCAPFKAQILTSGWGQGLECCVAAGGQWNGTSCDFTQPPAPLPVQPTPPVLTPQNIIPAMPDITQANAPVPVPTEDPSCWCQLNAAISNNPLIALAILAGVALIAIPKKGRA